MELLKDARIDGKTYDEIQKDVLKLTYYYVGIFVDRYPLIKMHNRDVEQLVTDVFYTFYKHPKKNDRGYSNLEETFIKASEQGFTMSYISNFVRKSVILLLSCVSRDLSKKPTCVSLDQTIYQEGDKDICLEDTIASNDESLEDVAMLNCIMDSIPTETYADYHRKDFYGKKYKLNSKQVLNWIISGYTISEMASKVFDKKGNNIPYNIMASFKRRAIELARTKFYESK